MSLVGCGLNPGGEKVGDEENAARGLETGAIEGKVGCVRFIERTGVVVRDEENAARGLETGTIEVFRIITELLKLFELFPV